MVNFIISRPPAQTKTPTIENFQATVLTVHRPHVPCSCSGCRFLACSRSVVRVNVAKFLIDRTHLVRDSEGHSREMTTKTVRLHMRGIETFTVFLCEMYSISFERRKRKSSKIHKRRDAIIVMQNLVSQSQEILEYIGSQNRALQMVSRPGMLSTQHPLLYLSVSLFTLPPCFVQKTWFR